MEAVFTPDKGLIFVKKPKKNRKLKLEKNSNAKNLNIDIIPGKPRRKKGRNNHVTQYNNDLEHLYTDQERHNIPTDRKYPRKRASSRKNQTERNHCSTERTRFNKNTTHQFYKVPNNAAKRSYRKKMEFRDKVL